MQRIVAPALFSFIITLAALIPSALTLPEHGDEAQYAWSAAYFGNKLVHLDFSPYGSDRFTDPGWDPLAFWSLTQPMGARMLYALTMSVTGLPAPASPFSFTDPVSQGLETRVAPDTLFGLRLAAIFCAALGLALIASRFLWPGVFAALLFLLIPHARADLARAWAEGPLLLGFGLCAIAYRSRWFGPVCGLVATFKLTALGLWPLAFWHGFGKSRLRHVLGACSAALVWTLLTPPSWFLGGPSYLWLMIFDRYLEYSGQAADYANHLGLYLPTRYLWPLELLALLTVITLSYEKMIVYSRALVRMVWSVTRRVAVHIVGSR